MTATRRSIIASAPAAVALAATGVAVALPAVASDHDPGLALIEKEYARWRAMKSESSRLHDRAEDLVDQAQADRPMLIPAPEPAPEIVPWIRALRHEVPQRLLKKVDAHFDAMIDWRHAHPSLEGHPAYEQSRDCEAEADRLSSEAWELRGTILKIPTRAPRGILLKLVVAFEADTLDEVRDSIDDTAGDCGNDFAAGILPDLEAMARSAVA
jgi:hypothetical protein